jgi:uncharacterized membrane protein (UPF0127 family)
VRALVAAALVVAACQSQGGPPGAAQPVVAKPKVTDVTAQDFEVAALPRARVTLVDAFGFKHVVDAEVAATREARTRGLMWRTALPEGSGMLFIFPQEEELNFWMKNTLIPLDMIFIRADRTILDIVENATPKTLTPRNVPGDSQFVLEVNAGVSAKRGFRAGQKVDFYAPLPST